MPMALGLGLGLPYIAAASGPYPALDLNFAASGTLDSRVTYTGASLATLTDATGAIAYKPHNLLTYSGDLSNAVWTKTLGASTTSGSVTIGTGAASEARSKIYLLTASKTFTASVQIAVASGTAKFRIKNTHGGVVDNYSSDLTATTTPQWFSLTVNNAASAGDGSQTVGIVNASDASSNGVTFLVTGAQLNIGPLQPYYPTTSATYFGPRFTYDPVTHAALGLLIEEQRSNLCRNSEALNGTGWTSTNQSVTLAAGTAPDGTSNANRLTATAGSGAKQTYNTVGSATTVTTNTIYAKAGTANWIALAFDVQGVTDGAFFNLATGVVGTVAASTTASITPVGNGWYRCSVTRTYASANHTITVEIHTADAQGVSWAAAGTETVLVWGAQLEAGAFATSYIPTTSASVTRAADSATMMGSNFSSWFNATQGTFVAETYPSNVVSLTARAVWVENASTGVYANYLMISGSTTTEQFEVSSGGATQFSQSRSPVTSGARTKAALAYASGAFAGALNGGTPITAASGSLPPGLDTARIGFHRDGTALNAPIARLRYYPVALTNAQLQALTT